MFAVIMVSIKTGQTKINAPYLTDLASYLYKRHLDSTGISILNKTLGTLNFRSL
jgi:hypothetical protein